MGLRIDACKIVIVRLLMTVATLNRRFDGGWSAVETKGWSGIGVIFVP